MNRESLQQGTGADTEWQGRQLDTYRSEERDQEGGSVLKCFFVHKGVMESQQSRNSRLETCIVFETHVLYNPLCTFEL